MKISKTLILRMCLIVGLILSARLGFAENEPVLLPPDGGNKTPPAQPNRVTVMPSASAILSDTELAVYFDYSVGDATITVYDTNNNVVVSEQTADTNSTSEVFIPVDTWPAGEYRITVTYGTTTQQGYFQLN